VDILFLVMLSSGLYVIRAGFGFWWIWGSVGLRGNLRGWRLEVYLYALCPPARLSKHANVCISLMN
jgi:hypothetical protein